MEPTTLDFGEQCQVARARDWSWPCTSPGLEYRIPEHLEQRFRPFAGFRAEENPIWRGQYASTQEEDGMSLSTPPVSHKPSVISEEDGDMRMEISQGKAPDGTFHFPRPFLTPLKPWRGIVIF